MTNALKLYESEIQELINYFIRELSFLNISCIKVFGSATNDELFVKNSSDIDIIAYTNCLNYQDVTEIIRKIKLIGGNFVDKQPLFLKDFINARIEFNLKINDALFDINIFPNEIYGYELIRESVLHDALDIFFGGMNLYSIDLFGKFEPLEKIKSEIYPFYSNDIRNDRLLIIEDRLKRLIIKIEEKLKNGDNDVFEYILKSRAYFVKWLFIYNKVYPLDIYKHLPYQLSNFLNLDKKDIDTILLSGNRLVNDLSMEYIEFIKESVKVRRR